MNCPKSLSTLFVKISILVPLNLVFPLFIAQIIKKTKNKIKTMWEIDDIDGVGYGRSLNYVTESLSEKMIKLEQLMSEVKKTMDEVNDVGYSSCNGEFKRLSGLMDLLCQEKTELEKLMGEVEESKAKYLHEKKNKDFMQPGNKSGRKLPFKNLEKNPLVIYPLDSVSRKTFIKKQPIKESPESSNSLRILDSINTFSTVKSRRVCEKKDSILNLPRALPIFPEVLPQQFVNRIQEIGGSLDKLVLIINKKLFRSDLSKIHNRLSIPYSKVLSSFLISSEKDDLDNIPRKKIKTTLIQPCLEECEIFLSNWKSNSEYALVSCWNDVCRRNKLKKGMNIQLWSFRRNLDLCFALVTRKN